MAQTSIRGYYSVRRKREDHASIKRRKLTEDTRVDIPVLNEHTDPSSIAITEPQQITTSQKKTRTSRKGTRARSTTQKRKTRAGKSKDEPSLQTLFDIIQKDREKTTEAVDPCESEQPLPTFHFTGTSNGPSSKSDGTAVQPPPQRSGTSTPAPSPLSSPVKPFSRGATLVSLAKERAATRSRSSTPATKTPQSSPIKPQPQAYSRGAALVRMAKEKMTTKSSQEAEGSERVTRMAARRKLLANPDMSELKPLGEPVKQLSREEMVGKLYKLSAKELAKPTQFEEGRTPSRTTRRQKSSKEPKLREFASFEFKSPVKSQPPAYERYHALAEPSVPDQSPTKQHHDSEKLPLPFSYQTLLEKFRSTDTVTTMLQKRKEICTFSKLKKAVQEMTRKQFEERNLAQMKTVYPTAYVFRQEKNIPGNYVRSQYAKYQLTVECNANSEGVDGTEQVQLGPSTLIKRRKIFQTNLTSIIKKHHKQFLAKLDPPLAIPDDRVMRWHPAFPLDSIPEVEQSELPKPPVSDTYMTAQDVLKATRGQLPSRVQAALSNVASSASVKGEKQEGKKREVPNTDPALKGVSEALLEKIRAKEAAKVELQITRDPQREKQLEMMGRLPDFVRILRNYFVVEKKAALPWDDVVQKLGDSHQSGLPTDRVEEHLACLSELVPKWINIVNVRKRKYVKIDKKGDLKQVTTRLEDARRKILAGS